jgi:hypothetical protein
MKAILHRLARVLVAVLLILFISIGTPVIWLIHAPLWVLTGYDFYTRAMDVIAGPMVDFVEGW